MSNTSTDHSEWNEHSERRELARLLPPPPHPEPSLSQLAIRRDVLLAEFARPRPFAALTARWRGLVAVTAIVTATAVTAVTFTPDPSSSVQDQPGASAASVELLNRIAQAAQSRPQPPVQDSQFTYSWTIAYSTALSELRDGTMARTVSTVNKERWTAVNGSRDGLLRSDGVDERLPADTHPALNGHTYRQLTTLPTETDALLKLIYDTAANDGPDSGSTTGPDQEAFVTISDMLRGLVIPPQTASALYRVAARIPGVIAVDDAVDATGRHGVAVARVNDGQRLEWIFDRTTLALLGIRTVLLTNGPWGRSGDESESTAILTQGIVGAPGEPVPPAPVESSQ
ncbi:CU044_5270 family protein [Kitasatospora sp. NPDC057500]|uniref:CU044_5270 family protein n=1 Tax=Kitasatospora sp. NPDC057500 TaxID=3346151 RepID=UPI0036812AAF